MNIETFHGGPLVQLREDSHGIPMGIPTEILWEWEWKFHSHGNPGIYVSLKPEMFAI